ncbi:hypothetical protein UPYG_G00000010, partial [Umbra pygmaea]
KDLDDRFCFTATQPFPSETLPDTTFPLTQRDLTPTAMSISRNNWSALSRLARQWTVEDEEEVEREKRRKERSYSSTDPDEEIPAENPGNHPSYDSPQSIPSVEQQLDFVEMLRVRDERRRIRHVESLRRKKDEEEGGEEGRVELLGDLEECGGVMPTPDIPCINPLLTPAPMPSDPAERTQETGPCRAPYSETDAAKPKRNPPSNTSQKFVSSLSISFDKSPSQSGPTSPMSPHSPATVLPSTGAQSLTHYRQHEDKMNGSFTLEQTSTPAFARQSSRTTSFRMLRKKEEENKPLQRSASVRVTSKIPSSSDQAEEEDKTTPFQRNSRQRVSSRSIQEKMERLAQASQKSESVRSPDSAQRTLFLLEEVSRKRGIFEKDQAAAPGSPEISRQEHRSFTSGISDRINRWISKTNKPGGSSHNPTDLRHVDIASKRSVFESQGEDSSPKPVSQRKVYK